MFGVPNGNSSASTDCKTAENALDGAVAAAASSSASQAILSGGEVHANDNALRESFVRLLPSPRFVLGANLPWVGYGTDIGASAWYPSGGLSSQPASLDLLGGTFATLARDGISVVRTFLLCDVRSARDSTQAVSPPVWTTPFSWISTRWWRSHAGITFT